MRWKSRVVPVIAACLVSAAVFVAPDRGGAAAAEFPDIDALLRAAVQRGDAPGVVAMATDRRRVIYKGAFGAAESAAGRPLTTDAIFRIASMTKPITSVAAMQLVEKGQISLDDPAAKYLPELAQLSVLTTFDERSGAYTVTPASTTVTVRHLMTHTSGLGYPFTSAILRDFKPREGERFAAGPLLFEPGTQWLYGTNTDWLGRLVETVSRQSLDVYFRERIFDPLGMSDTFFNIPAPKQVRLVNLYKREANGELTEQPRQTPRDVTQFNGGGGLSSTAGDYIRFLQMLLNRGEGNGARILGAATVASMARNQIGSVGVRALKTAAPATSADFSFVNDGKDKWGLGFLITAEDAPGLRSAGSLSWGGIDNTYFWLDETKGVGGVILMQFLPFADPRALKVYQDFERAVYKGR
jgi:methyl acetate hydrolase